MMSSRDVQAKRTCSAYLPTGCHRANPWTDTLLQLLIQGSRQDGWDEADPRIGVSNLQPQENQDE
jgi:hypothetical protein